MISKSGILALIIATIIYLAFIYFSAKAVMECENKGGIYYKNIYGLSVCSKK